KFSITTSARPISFQRIWRPVSFFRLIPILFLLRFTDKKYVLMPLMNGGPHCRLSSPSGGGSTFMTWAPMSANSIVQTGPDKIRERSTTRRSSRGLIFSTGMYFSDHPSQRSAKAYQVSGSRNSCLRKNLENKAENDLLQCSGWLKYAPFVQFNGWL